MAAAVVVRGTQEPKVQECFHQARAAEAVAPLIGWAGVLALGPRVAVRAWSRLPCFFCGPKRAGWTR